MDLIALSLAAIGAALTLAWVVIGLVLVRRLRKSVRLLWSSQDTLDAKIKSVRSDLQNVSARVTKVEKQAYKLREVPSAVGELSSAVDELSDDLESLKDYTTRELAVVQATTKAEVAKPEAPKSEPKPKPAKRRKTVKVYADDDEIDIVDEEDDDDGVYPARRNARVLGGRGRGREYEEVDRDISRARRGPRDRGRDMVDSRRYR